MGDFALTIIYIQLIIGTIGGLYMGLRALIDGIKERRYKAYEREWFAAHPGASWNDFVEHNRSKQS